MLTVDYKEEWGYCTFPGCKDPKGLKTIIHPTNCLFAEIYHFKNNEGKKMATLTGFYADTQHMERCLKSLPHDRIYHFNTYYPLWKKVGRLLAKYGWQVKLYYKEPKN